jgi:hypothetical protein
MEYRQMQPPKFDVEAAKEDQVEKARINKFILSLPLR